MYPSTSRHANISDHGSSDEGVDDVCVDNSGVDGDLSDGVEGGSGDDVGDEEDDAGNVGVNDGGGDDDDCDLGGGGGVWNCKTATTYWTFFLSSVLYPKPLHIASFLMMEIVMMVLRISMVIMVGGG